MAQFATSKLKANHARILATKIAFQSLHQSQVAWIHKCSTTYGKHMVVCHELFFSSTLPYSHLMEGTKLHRWWYLLSLTIWTYIVPQLSIEDVIFNQV
jgi:hypothetical protein